MLLAASQQGQRIPLPCCFYCLVQKLYVQLPMRFVQLLQSLLMGRLLWPDDVSHLSAIIGLLQWQKHLLYYL